MRAQQLSGELAALAEDRKYLFGSHTQWRARIAAVLGEPEGAVRLLRQANREGVPYGVWIHTDVACESVRDDRSFRREVKPKG